MIKVWTDAAEAGLFDRHAIRGSSFVYLPEAAQARAVSVTMPVRLASWDVQFGLPPIFEMNLPEGALRERLRLAFAKATGTFDEFDLLGIVGRSQVGRVRYTGQHEQLQEDVPFQSVDEILYKRPGGELYRYLLDKFASFSGISGVQPKILVRDEASSASLSKVDHACRRAIVAQPRSVRGWNGAWRVRNSPFVLIGYSPDSSAMIVRCGHSKMATPLPASHQLFPASMQTFP